MKTYPITFIGATNSNRNASRQFGIKHDDRFLHMTTVGGTGTGKSTLLQNLIIQDIRNNTAPFVIDPHGTLVSALLNFIPKHRTNDVIVFNPLDEAPVGLNVLEYTADPILRTRLVSNILSIFQATWWEAFSNAPNMEDIIRNSVAALLEYKGATLLSMPRLLTDHEFRVAVIERITDPVVRDFWVKYDARPEREQREINASTLNKVRAFITTPVVRNVVAQKSPRLSIQEAMDSGKILLANLSKGTLGEDLTRVLGSMLLTKIVVSALAREYQPKPYTPVHLYIDEAHALASPIFDTVFSETRKYRLSMTLSYQYGAQLSDATREAIRANVGTRIVFNIGVDDAREYAEDFYPDFKINDFVNLPAYHIYLKLAIDNASSRGFSAVTLPPIEERGDEQEPDIVRARSREQYGRPRALIEEDVRRLYSQPVGPRRTKRAEMREPVVSLG
jgi:hypothetical protein